MIVVDANVVVPFFVGTEHTEPIAHLRTADSDWTAPPLWRSEMRNALLLFVRTRRLAIDEALEIQTAAEEMLKASEHEVRSEMVLPLAHASECSAYDCEYVALAMSLAVPLYTFDKRILRAFPDVAVRPA